MSDLVLGPVVGKLGGGAEVHTIPVDFVSSSGTGVKHVVDVPVPEGVAARVVVVGTSGVTNTSNSSWPRLIIGGQDIGSYYSSVGGSATVTGPTVVEVNRRSTSSLYDPSFVGTVYWWTESTGDPGGGGDTGGGGDEVVITGTAENEARDNFRAALSARGYDYKTIKTVPFRLDTSQVSNMSRMFEECSSLTSAPDMDTSNVTNMRSMFFGCSSLTSAPNMDTSNVTSMRTMFSDCSSLTAVPNIDTSNVTNMLGMFQSCASITAVPDMNTGNVTNMRSMFFGCSSLTSAPNMDTSNVTDMYGLFYNCAMITSVPDMDTSNAEDMSFMFQRCTVLTDGNVRCIGKKIGVDTSNMIDRSGLTRLPFYDTNGNWTG